MTNQKFKDCIDACVACAVACRYCAAACLDEDEVKMLTRCIKLDLECSSVCMSAVDLMSLDSEFSAHLCRVCADACNICAAECEKHAAMGMEHCQQCAEACRKCAAICETVATAA